MQPVRLLSVRQPWADALAAGVKPVENRRWSTPYRGWVLLHAPLTYDPDGAAFCRGLGFDPLGPGEAARGGVIGAARLVDVVRAHPSPWFFGPFGFVFADARPLPFVACPGALGLRVPPAGVLDALRGEL